MKSVDDSYTSFHRANQPKHVYPSEWVIRTFLGSYPRVCLDKHAFLDAKILDIGFGDGRNWPLLANAGFEVHGVEITDEVVAFGRQRAAALGIPVTLSEGRNTNIPYPDRYFDYILACNSCYYIDHGTTFNDVMKEYARVLKPGGYLIASLPEITGDICANGIDLGNGHMRITQDPWKLINGYVFRVFENREEVANVLGELFECPNVGLCRDDYYGIFISYFIVVARSRAAKVGLE